MVEFDGAVEVTGVDGPVPFLDLFHVRDELVVYKHMWYDGAPHQGQCEGCTTTAWHVQDAVYLNARGASFAVLTSGAWDEVAPYVEFMGYTQPWYSVRGLEAPVGGEMGHIVCFLRDGDGVFLTYSTTGRVQRAGQRVPRHARHDALRPPRGLGGQPRGRPEAPRADSPVGGHGSPICWYWRSDAGVATWARPAGVFAPNGDSARRWRHPATSGTTWR
jgi:hypothetical protein